MTTKKTYKSVSEKAASILSNSSMQIVCKLGDIMAERGLNQTEVAFLTGLRQATINSIIHNKNATINKEHSMVLMKTLKLTSLTELYDIVIEEDELKELEEEKAIVEANGLTPEQEQQLGTYKRNLKADTE